MGHQPEWNVWIRTRNQACALAFHSIEAVGSSRRSRLGEVHVYTAISSNTLEHSTLERRDNMRQRLQKLWKCVRLIIARYSCICKAKCTRVLKMGKMCYGELTFWSVNSTGSVESLTENHFNYVIPLQQHTYASRNRSAKNYRSVVMQ